jgi:hypothetical protein
MMQTLNIPTLSYKPERAYLVFPVEGNVTAASGQVRNRRAMVSCEVKKRPGGVLGYYHIRLLAVDFPDDTYTILYGTQEKCDTDPTHGCYSDRRRLTPYMHAALCRYDNEIMSGLRRPMVSWLRDSQNIDSLHELEDEIDEGVYQQMQVTPPAA